MAVIRFRSAMTILGNGRKKLRGEDHAYLRPDETWMLVAHGAVLCEEADRQWALDSIKVGAMRSRWVYFKFVPGFLRWK